MRRLSRSGLKMDFVRPAILPEWWDESHEDDPGLLPDVELRVARFLEVPIATIRDPEAELPPPAYPGAQLRRVRDLEPDRLIPAIHSALKIAEAVVRNLKGPDPRVAGLPASGIEWREELAGTAAVTLTRIVADLWSRGVPVIPIDSLPAPSFQALAGLIDQRPVIVLGHKHEEPGRVAFVVAHEAGHIAAGDCEPDRPVVDEQDDIADNTDLEQKADLFATETLVGRGTFPEIDGTDFRELAKSAAACERKTGADASALIFSWARTHGDYGTASRAVSALYRSTGARTTLRAHFDEFVDVEGAPESDRALLRCVYGGVDPG